MFFFRGVYFSSVGLHRRSNVERIIALVLLASLLLVGCRPASSSGNTSENTSGSTSEASPSVAGDSIPLLRTDSIRFALQSPHGSCEVIVDYPMEGPEAIVTALREFIISTLFDGNRSDLSDDPQEMVRQYCTERQAALTKTLEQMGITHVSAADAPEEGTEIRMTCLTARYVTYEIYRYSYITHGGHGEYSDYGVTFRLSDGHRFGDDLITGIDERFYEHIREGLKTYFRVRSDQQLSEICTADLSLMPMPTFPPYLTRHGICFHYSIYDICPFDWGDPLITIPFEAAWPYLTESARKLIKPDD